MKDDLNKSRGGRIGRAAFLITFLLLCCSAAVAQETLAATPTLGGIEEVYLAKDNGKGKAGDQVTEFGVADIPIHCVVLLGSTGKTKVKMNFVAVKVAGVKPETKVVTANYTTKDGQNRVNFTGRPYGKWTTGKYRVDIFLDGKLAKNIEFAITNNQKPAADTTKAELGLKPQKQL